MQSRTFLAYLLAAFLLPVPAWAQAEVRFSLADALRLMRAAHPLLVAARHGIDAAHFDVRATRLWTNPFLAGTYFKGVANSSYDRLGYIYYGVTQFVELANAPGARRRAAEHLVGAAREDRVSMDVELSLDVESALITLVETQQVMELLERTLSLLESTGKIVNERVAAGAAPRYDAARIAVTLAVAQADLAEAQADLARAWGELRAAVGPGGAKLIGEPDYDLQAAFALASPEELLEFLKAARPDLNAARERASSAQVEISVAKRNVLPGVGLNVNGGFGAAPHQFDVGAGLSVAIPVVDRGQGTIPAARARAHQAEAYVDAVLVPAALRIRAMHLEVETRRRALANYLTQGVTSGDEMLTEAQAGYVAGRFSVLELADAFRAWRDARLRLIALAANARQAEIDLGRTVGKPLRDISVHQDEP